MSAATDKLTPAEVLSRLAAVDPASILSAYIGRPGCACGCRGDYAYTTAGASSERRGYPVHADEISDKRAATRLRNAARVSLDRVVSAYDTPSFGGRRILSVETESRLYIVTLLPTVSE